MDASAQVKVLVRVRPFCPRETDASHGRSIVQMSDTATTILDPNNDYKVKDSFKYDRCFWSLPNENSAKAAASFASQDAIYTHIGPQVVDSMWQGYNTCLFAYGQTGSGKTYTMMGDINCSMHKGIIPRLCYDMFYRIKKEQSEQPTLSFKVDASYHEIYNEKVKDLLSRTNSQLKVRQHPQNGPFVEGLSSHQVNDVSGIYHLIKKGDQERSTAQTNLNERSSRSHAIFTLTVTRLEMIGEVLEDTIQTKSRASKINLVDLAGSERVAISGVQGERFEEARNINLSLTTLGRVIDCLVERQEKSKNPMPPYRESALTWLLSDSLGGNSKTFMVATISPSALNFSETLSTLRYSSKARNIINVATVNKEEESGKLTAELRMKIQGLQTKLRNFEKQEARNMETLEERCFQAETEAEALRTRVAALEAKLGKSKLKDGEEDRASKLLKEERSKGRRLEKQIKRLEQQLDVEQRNFVQETRELAQQLKNEQVRLGELQEEIDAKEEEVKRLFDDQDRVVSERDLLFEQLQRMRTERKQEHEGKTSEKEKSHRINVLRKIAKDQEEEKERVDKENKLMASKMAELQEKLTVLSAENAKQKKELESLTETQRQTATMTEASTKELRKGMEAANSQLKEQLDKYKAQLAEKDQQLKVSNNRVQNVMVELTTHAKEVTTLREELARVEEKASKEKKDTTEHQSSMISEIVQVKAELAAAQKQAREAEEGLKAAEEKLAATENKERQSTMVEKAHRDMVIEHNKTIAKIVEMQKTVVALKDEISTKEKLIEIERDKVALTQKEMAATEAELGSKAAEIKRLKQHIESLNIELSESSDSHRKDREAVYLEVEQEKRLNMGVKQQMTVLEEERVVLRNRIAALHEKERENDEQLRGMAEQLLKMKKQHDAEQGLVASLKAKLAEKENQNKGYQADIKKLKEGLKARENNPIENELVVLNRLLREKVQEQGALIESLEKELTTSGLDKINRMFDENAQEIDCITRTQCAKASDLKAKSVNSFRKRMITNIEEEEATIKKVREDATRLLYEDITSPNSRLL